MNYKNQMLRQLASGSFGKKTYMDIVRNKGNISNRNNKVTAKTCPIKTENVIETDTIVTDIIPINEINENVSTQNDPQIFTGNPENNQLKNNQLENNQLDNQSENNQLENNQLENNQLENNRIGNTNRDTKQLRILEDRVSELEDYIVVLISEIEKLKNNQSNIINVINKLSSELISAKSKIVR
jgi:hypothetical protein